MKILLNKPQSGLLAGLKSGCINNLAYLDYWWIDGFVKPFIPSPYHPDNILNTIFGQDVAINIRGLGVVVFLLFTTFVGWIAKGFLGRSLIRIGENLVRRMPVVRSIYSGVKQIAETVFAQSDRSFEKAV